MINPVELSCYIASANDDGVEYSFEGIEFGRHLEPQIFTCRKSVEREKIEAIRKAFEDTNDLANCIASQSGSGSEDDPRDGSVTSFRNLGWMMFDILLPDEAKAFLKDLNRPLLISTTESEWPWELLFDGREFLGIRHSIGRRLRDRRVGVSYTDLHAPDELSFLFIVNPTGDPELKENEGEARALMREIRRNLGQANVELLFGDRATWVEVEKEIRSGKYDVIHYIGHVGVDPKRKRSYLCLADQAFTADDAIYLERQAEKKRHPAVFLNGCESNSTANSIASGFLEGGARVVVADLYKVTPKGAKEFALSFYQKVFAGASVGEAIKQARTLNRDNRSAGSTWASYVLYGNPSQCLVVDNSVPRAERVQQAQVQAVEAPETELEPAVELFVDETKLNKNRFSPVAWQVMEWCKQEAKNTGWHELRTPHLFMALTRVQDGCTCSVLADQYLEPDLLRLIFYILIEREEESSSSEEQLRLEKDCLGQNLLKLLHSSEKEAATEEGSAIQERHLLQGILRDNKGFTVEMLKLLGISIPKMQETANKYSLEGTTFVFEPDPEPGELFLDDDALDRAQLTSSAYKILEVAAKETAKTGWAEMRTPHLFMALIQKNASVRSVLSRHNADPQVIYELFKTAMSIESSPQPLGTEMLAKSYFSKNMRKVLAVAKAKAGEHEASPIEEHHLFQALLYDEQGVITQVLRTIGVSPQDLRKSADDYLLEVDANNNSHAGETDIVSDEGGKQEDGPTIARERVDEFFSPDDSLDESRFSSRARKSLGFALEEAVRTGWSEIRTPHLFIGLTRFINGLAYSVLSQSVRPEALGDLFRRALTKRTSPSCSKMQLKKGSFSENMLSVLAVAGAKAQETDSSLIEEAHLFQAVLQESEITRDIIRQAGLSLSELQSKADRLPAEGTSFTPFLDDIGRDLTKEAKAGILSPVVGRDKEIQKLIQVLARMDKASVALIGEAGVGKTAIVEGLALRIASGSVPEYLKGSRVVEIPTSSLVEGTMYRGTFEQRLRKMIQEASQKGIIVFIDELHTLVGAGQTMHSDLDAGNMLKPALAKGDIRCIGATTPKEFAGSIERDTALARRFEKMIIHEPSIEVAEKILQVIKENFQKHYNVAVAEGALKAAVELSIRYLPERRLPDKARDVLMNACVRADLERHGREKPLIDVDAIAKEVAEASGVPVERLTEAEQTELLGLRDSLRKRIVGQDEAVSSLADAILMSRTGLSRRERPVGVFLFMGPSGVGKTFLVKLLAEQLFGSADALIRLDLGEFKDRGSIARLIGAAPGYIGYGDEGQLTGPLRRKPYSIVLLDEIEKAHPEVYDLFLQLFDEGQIADSQGNVVDGRNAIFIMTSNVASDGGKIGFTSADKSSNEPAGEGKLLRGHGFKKEFLNRIDKTIVFRSLSDKDMREIVKLQLQELAQDVMAQRGIGIRWTRGAVSHIADKASRQRCGRSVQQLIRDEIRIPLSKIVAAGLIGNEILIRMKENRIELVSTPSE